jgi:hypothetical protein
VLRALGRVRVAPGRWKNHDDLEQAFVRLLADLKASA